MKRSHQPSAVPRSCRCAIIYGTVLQEAVTRWNRGCKHLLPCYPHRCHVGVQDESISSAMDRVDKHATSVKDLLEARRLAKTLHENIVP